MARATQVGCKFKLTHRGQYSGLEASVMSTNTFMAPGKLNLTSSNDSKFNPLMHKVAQMVT